eukprot:146795-Rhodomonas_salina.2
MPCFSSATTLTFGRQIWGLLSSWNPNWAYNQEHLLSLKETEEGDVIESLTGLLKRKDVDVRNPRVRWPLLMECSSVLVTDRSFGVDGRSNFVRWVLWPSSPI